jgi:hypothetical protein
MEEEEAEKSAAVGSRLDALHRFVARVAPERVDTTAHVDAVAAEVLDAFDRAGVDALLLKGQALGLLLYAPGEHRGYSDVDLLVAPHQFDAAGEVLVRLGYVNTDAAKEIDDVGGIVHGQTWTCSAPASMQQPTVDVHRWLPGARVAAEIAWHALSSRRTWIEVGGRTTAVLDRAGQALQLATHAAQHGPAFVKHTDELALALARWPPEVWEAASTLADEVGAVEAFAAGLRLVPAGSALAGRLALPSTAELGWTIQHRHGRPRGTFHLRALADAETWGERLQILRRSLFPRRAWIIQQHSWARGSRLRLLAAYGFHLLRAPVWATRAWMFRRRGQRAARRADSGVQR